MTLYIAHNTALDATTAFTGGQSYATGAKTALQLQLPSSQVIRIAEIGWSQDVATATSTLLALQTSNTGTTDTTALSTTLVKPLIDNDARGSSLTMATTGSSYGIVAVGTRTVLRNLEQLYVPQVYVKQWPLGQWPIVGNAAAETFVCLNVNTTATVNAICWIVWDEA
jgi:hypothetical protein